MEINNNFKFTINVSREGYTNKKEAIACLNTAGAKAVNKSKMSFKEQTITTTEFLQYAVTGHSFCNLFQFDENKKYWINNKSGNNYAMYPTYKTGINKGYMKISFKSDEFFKSSQCIFLDIDYTKYNNITDYIDTLTYKPTCVYMSYSDNIYKKDVAQKNNPAYTEEGIKSRRFRLIYVFNEQMNKNQLNSISAAINNQIELDTKEPIQDKCGVKVSQYFNGCYNNNETYNTNIIYSYSDFNIKEEEIIIAEPEVAETIDNEVKDDLEYGVDQPLISYHLVNDMSSLSYDTFMRRNRKKYKYIYRAEKEDWIEDKYQFTDDSYFSLYYNVATVTDGQKRRKKLFERMCLRRVLDHDATPDTILFDAYEDVHKYFDNSDKVLSVDCLVRNVENAFKLTIEEIEEKYSENLAYLRSRRPKIILKKGVAFSIAERNTELKEIRYSLIDEVYDVNKSILENLQYINNNIFKICEKTLYNYCNNRNLKNACTVRDEDIMSLYNKNLSLRKNLEVLKANGLKVSYGRLQKLVKNTIEEAVVESELPIIESEEPTVESEEPVKELEEKEVEKELLGVAVYTSELFNSINMPSEDWLSKAKSNSVVASNKDFDFEPIKVEYNFSREEIKKEKPSGELKGFGDEIKFNTRDLYDFSNLGFKW